MSGSGDPWRGVGCGSDTEPLHAERESRLAGPVRPQGSYRFGALSGQETEVTFGPSAELGGLKKLVMERSVQRAMDGEMANPDRAKQLLESCS